MGILGKKIRKPNYIKTLAWRSVNLFITLYEQSLDEQSSFFPWFFTIIYINLGFNNYFCNSDFSNLSIMNIFWLYNTTNEYLYEKAG